MGSEMEGVILLKCAFTAQYTGMYCTQFVLNVEITSEQKKIDREFLFSSIYPLRNGRSNCKEQKEMLS